MTGMSLRKAALGLVAAAAVMGGGGPARAAQPSGKDLLRQVCSGCHAVTPSGGLDRISDMRKSPEGWELTVSRMERWHHVAISPSQEAAIIKWLADHQGLAPEEAAPFRYALERRPVVEKPDDAQLAGMCASCHTYARIALQRRNKDEWLKLVNMHVGQWPNIEYVATSRGRHWWKLASTEIPARLGAKWPLSTEAWTRWQAHRPADLSGSWRVAGHRPGKGDYAGDLTVRRQGGDRYTLAYRITYADGTKLTGGGSAVLYTGYEWRGTATLGNERIREVYALSDHGNRLSGRWYVAGQDAIGADVVAVRGHDAIAAVEPSFIRAGRPTQIRIIGSGLDGRVRLGAGVTVDKVVSASPGAVTVVATAAKSASPGDRPVSVGRARAAHALVVYDRIAALKVEPAVAVARMGGNGGPIPAALAQFEAVAFAKGADGAPLRVGPVAAKWSLANFDKAAEKDHDLQFGGHLGPHGLFTPGLAGPNPARGGYDNAANLAVKAAVVEDGREVRGQAHLLVAPQRWNDAPIR